MLRRLIQVILATSLALAVGLAAAASSHLTYTIWSDRDLLRAASPWTLFPTTGAEMNGTYMARVPGGAYYLLLRLLMLGGGDPPSVKLAQFALLAAVLLAVAIQVRGLWGARAAMIAPLLLLSSPAIAGLTVQVWNPALSIPLVGLAMIALVRLAQGRGWALPLLVFAVSIAVQVHLSNLALALGCIVAAVLTARGVRPRHGVAALLVGVAVLAPYILTDWRDGWTNTVLIFQGQGQPPISKPHFLDLLRALTAILGSPDSDLTALPPGIPARLVRAAAWTGLAGLFVATVLAAVGIRLGVNPLAWRARLAAASEERRAFLALAIVVLVISVLLVVNRNSTIYLRYATPLTVPLVMMAAAAAAAALDWIERRGKPVAALAAVSVVVSALGWSALFAWPVRAHGDWPEPVQRAVLSLTRAGLDPAAVRERVMVLGTTQVYMDYLLENEPSKGRDDGSCVALLPVGGEQAAEQALQALEQTSGIEPVERLWSKPSPEGGWTIGYRLPHGNCWRNVDNPYHPFPVEDAVNAVCRHMVADGVETVPLGEGARLVIRRTADGFRFCAGLDVVAAADGGTLVTLTSTQLRGYTGYPSDMLALDHPSIGLMDADGRTLAEGRLVDGRLGSQNNPVRTPWRTELPVPFATVSGIRLNGALTTVDGRERIDVTPFGRIKSP